jgi:hypothetical protein
MTSALALDYSSYDLTELQLDLLKRFEDKGFSEEKLYRFASIFERSNHKIDVPEYIPPHTKQELYDTEMWAAGGAFFSFAESVGVIFDKDQYIKDCPNWAIFGFLKATAREHIDYDIMKTYTNTMFELDHAKRKDPEVFRSKYLKLAEKRGFLKYMTIL